MLDVIAPFTTREHTCGVDLIEPSLFVRIVPRKLAGAPHVIDTRIHTEARASLSKRGFGVEGRIRIRAATGDELAA